VGLGYLQVGQPPPPCPAAKPNAVKLSAELSRGTPATLYILDEPTTGLHFARRHKLLEVLLNSGTPATPCWSSSTTSTSSNGRLVIDLGPEGGSPRRRSPSPPAQSPAERITFDAEWHPGQQEIVRMRCLEATDRAPHAATGLESIGSLKDQALPAQAAASRDLVARSHSTRADALLRASKNAEAFNTLTNNLSDATPAEWRSDALLSLSQIPLAPPQIDTAITLFSALAGRASNDLGASAARVAVAELRLQQHFAAPTTPPASNSIAEARLLLSGVLSNAPSPTVAGRAWYGLGWCSLVADQPGPALQAFQQAAHLLPPSTAQALAHFKLGDAYLQITNYAAASPTTSKSSATTPALPPSAAASANGPSTREHSPPWSPGEGPGRRPRQSGGSGIPRRHVPR
jgi:tetratricopeptide (TPR) repeat protein